MNILTADTKNINFINSWPTVHHSSHAYATSISKRKLSTRKSTAGPIAI
jgi:hypothetical protein